MMKKTVIYALSLGVSLLVGTESLYAATGKVEINPASKKTMRDRFEQGKTIAGRVKKGVQNRMPGTERYKMRQQAKADAKKDTADYKEELQKRMQQGKTVEATDARKAALEKKYGADKYAKYVAPPSYQEATKK